MIGLTADGREIGVCRDCGARYDDADAYRVTCPTHRPSGVDVEPHPLLGRRATRTDDASGERVSGTIVIVETRASGHAMLGLDVDQPEHGLSLHAAHFFEIGEESGL